MRGEMPEDTSHLRMTPEFKRTLFVPVNYTNIQTSFYKVCF